MKNPLRNQFALYDRSFGDRLMEEARQRGLNRSEFVRRACDYFIERNPVANNQDNAKK